MGRFKRVLFVAGFLLLTFGVAAATLDFRLARAATNTKTGYSTANAKLPGGKRVVPGNRVYLHVEDREGIGGTFAWEVRRHLQEKCGWTVTLLNNDPGPEDFPLVLVAVRDDDTFWTPFYAGGSVKLFAKFASNTTRIMVDTGAAVFDEDSTGSEIVPLVVALNATVESSVAGIVSLPSFREELMRDVAGGFAEHVKDAVAKAESDVASTIRADTL